MSEDDVDALAPDGQGGSARVDRDRRAPRFSWTPAYEATFFRSLCESVQLGLRENSSFKAEAWERAAAALQATHGAYPAKSHLINKSDNARKRFRLWRGLREDPEFLYNPVTRTVTATEDAWRAHIEREPLSRALRGRPFDHEDYMEILYPDVVGSGGAPKRIMKPRRKTDGAVEDSDMPGTGVINLQGNSQAMSSPGRPALSETPTGSSSGSIPPQPRPPATATTSTSIVPIPAAATASSSALTPPDETVPQTQTQGLARKRRPGTGTQAEPTASPSLEGPTSANSSPQKRRRTSSRGAAMGSSAPTLTSSLLTSQTREAPGLLQYPLIEEVLDALKSRGTPRWREQALDIFFKDFATEELDLQVKISENILSNENKAMVFCKMPDRVRQHWVGKFREMHQLNKSAQSLIHPLFAPPSSHLSQQYTDHPLTMSYADIAASGPKQSPEEAAAPQPPEVVTNETASTASLIDVDVPSVHTVPSDFAEQDVQTETQAQRLEREAAAKKVKAKRNAKKTDNWLVEQFSKLSDGSAGALAVANLAGVVGLSAFLGYKAWGLYERGRLGWDNIGLGVGILAAVGAAEGVLGRYLYKGKKE